MGIYFGYVRVSGLGQAEKDGPLRQKEAITSFCAAHKLSLDPAIYEEVITGTSAGPDRSQFSKMLARILEIRGAGGEADGIVLEQASRIARDLIEGELIFRECRKLGIKVFAADRGLVDLVTDDSNPTLKLIRQVIGAVAEFEKSALVLKLRVARDRIRKETGRCEGRKQYGTFLGELPCLQTIEMLYKQGQSAGRIANELNTVGFRNRKGGLWIRQTIEHLIKSRRLTKTAQ